MRSIPWAPALVMAGLATVPLWGPGYHLEFLTVALYWVGLASAWNLMSGHTGCIDFGAVAHVGVGAYAAGVLVQTLGWPLLAAVAAAGGVCALLALAVGYPTLRLRGSHFAIASFALAATLQQVAEEWDDLTGGGMGMTITARLAGPVYYWLYLGLDASLLGLAWWRGGSRLGYALRAIRQDESAARRVGVDTHAAKLWAYVQSALFLGLFGALDATRLSYIKPDDAFNVHITIKMVVMSLLGGLGTLLGPVLGALSLQLLEDLLGARFLSFYLVLVGLIIMGLVLGRPQGLLGGRWRHWGGGGHDGGGQP